MPQHPDIPKFPSKIVEMYDGGPYDIGNSPIFGIGSGFINYGLWIETLPPEESPVPNEMRNRASVNLYRYILELTDVGSQDELLEIGPGRGMGAQLIHDVINPLRYQAIDFSHAQTVHTNNQIASQPRMFVTQAEAASIPFANSSYDAAISVEVLQHIEKPVDFFREAFRVLRPGGIFVFCSFFPTGDEHVLLLKKMMPTAQQGLDFLHPINSILSLLVQTGFNNIENIPIGQFVWKQLIRYCTQMGEKWSQIYIDAYEQGLLDYNIVAAQRAYTKPTCQDTP